MATRKKNVRKTAKQAPKSGKKKAVKAPPRKKSTKRAGPIKVAEPTKKQPLLLQLNPQEPLGIGIRRILTEEIRKVACFTEQPDEQIHTSIHEMRRILKRIRAVIWIMEPDLGNYNCHRESAVYRDIGRKISLLRSLYVNRETARKLQLEFPRKLAEGPLKRTEQLLNKHYEEAVKKALQDQDLINSLKKDIAMAMESTEALHLVHDDLNIPLQSLRMAFKSGRKRWRMVARKANSINIHELRKEVKNLQFQMQFLEQYDPAGIHKRIEPLQRLAQLSGTEHDHYELMIYIKKYLPGEELKKELLARLSQKILAYRKQILPQARKFYGMKSKKFIMAFKLQDRSKEIPEFSVSI